MSIRSERIKQLISQSNLSYMELEKITGIKKSSLHRYASGTSPKIPLDVIEKLSRAFNVPQKYLMGWDDETKQNAPGKVTNLSEGEMLLAELVELFRQLPEDSQKIYIEVLRQTLLSRRGENQR